MPTDLAALLSPRQLEALQEVAFELEDCVLEPEDDLLLSFLLAAGAPRFRGGPAPAQPRRRSRDLSPLERERAQEILDELQGEDRIGLRLPAVISRQEMAELLAAVKERHHRDYVIIRLLYATGCRRSELQNMRLADLYLDEQRIFVRDGKGNKDRYVLIDKSTAKLLDDFTYGRALDDPVFDIQDRQINRRVVHWAEQTGLSRRYEAQNRTFTSHAIRHAFATHMHESGVDLYTLRDLLGHRYLTTTQIYVHVGVCKRLSDYEKSHPLAQEP